jgi:hypothetical protein
VNAWKPPATEDGHRRRVGEAAGHVHADNALAVVVAPVDGDPVRGRPHADARCGRQTCRTHVGEFEQAAADHGAFGGDVRLHAVGQPTYGFIRIDDRVHQQPATQPSSHDPRG